MPKITDRKVDDKVIVKTQTKKLKDTPSDWWNSNSKKEMAEKFLSTVDWLKQQNQAQYRQAAIYSRLYGNMPLAGIAGSNLNRMNVSTALPMDRPTRSVITSGIDTLVSRLTLSKPKPVFLTENGDYKQRTLAKQVNQFLAGEFYQCKAYRKGPIALRDAGVLGTGCLKVLETPDKRVGIERRLKTELLWDANDSFYGRDEARMLYELKLIDRQVVAEQFSKSASMISRAQNGSPDQSGEKTISDQIIVAEGWRLPSNPESGDGMHVMACTEGLILDEQWVKPNFPFAFLDYYPEMTGPWGMGLAKRQMGTQMGINQLLMTMTKSINLVGVPRVFVEDGSKVVKAHLNNEVGTIVTYRGTKPAYEVAPCVPVEMYQQLERLIQFAYQDEGISELMAASQKPPGLNSGESIRRYDDIQSDRFNSLMQRYIQMYIDLAYLILDKATDIAERDKKYQTVYPDKDGTREINLPEIKKLKDNPFVIQCFDESSLPRDPAGRQATIVERVQAGLYTPEEGRRLMGDPDLAQEDNLLNAAEERILKQLDDIVEHGKYSPPDPCTDLQKAILKATQYYNRYVVAKLEEDRADMILRYKTQAEALVQAATPPAPAPGVNPQAQPMPAPQSPMIPNVPGIQGAA